MGPVAGGEGDGGVAGLPVQYVKAPYIQPGVLEPLGDLGQCAGLVGQPDDQGIVCRCLEAGVGQGVEGPVGVVGDEGDDALFSGLLCVQGLRC